ncbi:MAG TPA: radical SAM protein [Blastocatellia bacterium]|nr:radical SAM protein [Blastocatellia bacterium]
MSALRQSTSFRISSRDFQPAYRRLYESGELAERVQRARALLESCTACPRLCRVNRLENKTAVCRTGRYARVSSYFPHFGEEDCLRGWRGSGTIFFSMCNLRCVFCQNYDISQGGQGREVRPEELADMMIELQHRGCHNINFVTPEHVVPQILEALPLAIERGLNIPLVYNTSAYDSLESLRLLDGIVDIYMPDFKFWDPEMSLRYVKARDYPEAARQAIREMHRQVGDLVFDEYGLAKRGLLIRHLVMPGGIAGTREIMRFIAREISPMTYVNIMAQYYPAGRVSSEKYPEINRRLRLSEYEEAVRIAHEEGLFRLDSRERRWPAWG